jgi:aspartyl-tRNA(Asn)/glutamyl-tRNA(Gln) amidotransferase subunit A
VVGLKPGWGEIPAAGVIPLSRQLDHVGPLARSVADAGLLYYVMFGDNAPRTTGADDGVQGLRFARLEGYFAERLSVDVAAAMASTYDVLAQGGATLTRATLAHAQDIAPVYLHLVLADAAAYHAASLQERPHAYTDNVRIRLEMGRHVLAEDYVRALRGREVITREIDAVIAPVDAVLLPALAIEAPPLGAATVPVQGGQEPVRNAMLRCTQPFNVSGHPAISIPCAVTPAGLPVGLQIVGHRSRTADLLRVAQAIERTLQRHA